MPERLSMEDYLKETEYAVKSILDLIFKEETKLKNILGELSVIKGELESLKSLYNIFLGMEYDLDGYSDAKIQNAYTQWYKQQERMPPYRLEEAKRILESKKVKLELIRETNDSSIRVLCGSLLQIAKQGISIIYGRLENCPSNRPINVINMDEPLKNFIWFGRNQSLHFEEGKIKSNEGRMFFERITAAYSDKFNNVDSLNYAKEIIEILKWFDYECYENDMLLLRKNREMD